MEPLLHVFIIVAVCAAHACGFTQQGDVRSDTGPLPAPRPAAGSRPPSEAAASGSHTATRSAEQETPPAAGHPPVSSQSPVPPLSSAGATLSPRPAAPLTGDYTVTDSKHQVCIKARLGAQFMVKKNKKTAYFNISPTSTQAQGQCGQSTAWLLLSFSEGFVNFTFVKEGSISYVDEIRASLHPTATCVSCTIPGEEYTGKIVNVKLFKTADGHAYTCNSQYEVFLAENLSLRIVNTQMQAFNITNGRFGQEEECSADWKRRTIPIILVATVVGLSLIVILSCLIIREHDRGRYERI
uniref:Lysosome-associated membrane glycoprotein 3 n=1 Tax=Lepisosteus oculatus TaxID=7918 RepID=W5LXP0_LEPOC|nr:PREDICTED: lysosome-associated membrane glycoprotein 3 isoform X1 [Lepisosteus oculatus]